MPQIPLNNRPRPLSKLAFWRKEQETPSETTPLMRTPPPLDEEAPAAVTASTRAWNRLRQAVHNGTFLTPQDSGEDETEYFDSFHERPDDLLQSRRDKAMTHIRSMMDFNLTTACVAILCYMVIGVIAFSFVFEHWSIEQSIYYSLVTFTTIGYGDVTPDTAAGRIFTCFFALSGVAFLGIALGVIGNNVIEAQERAVSRVKSRARQVSKYQVLSIFRGSDMPQIQQRVDDASAEAQCTGSEQKRVPDLNAPPEEEDCMNQERRRTIALEFSFVILILGLFALLVANDPGIGAHVGFSIGDACYFTLITATTIGYGDFAPTSSFGRVVAIFFIPLVVGAMGHFLSVVANAVMQAKQAKVHNHLMTKELTIDDLEVMDTDGDGNVSYVEFLSFMLVAMDKVDKPELEELRATFDRLDRDGNGKLEKDDLIQVARDRLKKARRKLELARYKQEVLRKAEEAQHKRNTSIEGIMGFFSPKS